MTSNHPKALVQQWIEQGWNKDLNSHLALIPHTFHPSWLGHTPLCDRPLSGLDGVRRLVHTLRSAFPNLHLRTEFLTTEDDMVAVRYWTNASHLGPLLDLPPTGNQVSFRTFAVHRFSDGLISESWEETDALKLFSQLGVYGVVG
jgi:predicted ester cyclase